MHALFSGLHVAEVEKVTYFVEGFLPSMKIEVLQNMPETLQEANALIISGHVPAVATGSNSQPPVDQQIQSINTKLDVLASKLIIIIIITLFL